MCCAAHWQDLGTLPKALCSLGIAFTGLETAAERPAWVVCFLLLTQVTVCGRGKTKCSCRSLKSQGVLPRVGFSPVLVFSVPLFLCPEKGAVPLLSHTAGKSLLSQTSFCRILSCKCQPLTGTAAGRVSMLGSEILHVTQRLPLAWRRLRCP